MDILYNKAIKTAIDIHTSTSGDSTMSAMHAKGASISASRVRVTCVNIILFLRYFYQSIMLDIKKKEGLSFFCMNLSWWRGE
jgi:hypothetical protein